MYSRRLQDMPGRLPGDQQNIYREGIYTFIEQILIYNWQFYI